MLSEDKLPLEYKEAMKELLQDEYKDYIDSLSKPSISGMRVNTLKIKKEELLKLLNLNLREVKWADTGFYLDDDLRLSKSPYYYAGLYYMQEPSAMSPASLCEAKRGDKILDLCAAPGGKSTQIACKLEGEGLILSNDLSNSRAKALLKNIELSGIRNTVITCEEPQKLAGVYEEYFDKILVDAPCSGEGMFRRDIAVFNAYLKRGPENFAPIQASILDSAARMLKKGGYMIYSTCTYSKLEDEDTVLEFLKRHEDFEIGVLPVYEGFTPSKYVDGAVRLFPHKLEGEGHFVCKLVKKGESKEDESETKYSKAVKLPKSVLEFLKLTNISWDDKRFYINNEYVYYLPEGLILDKKLRYLRTGLLIGRMNNNRFEPSQAFAMSLKYEDWKNPVNLSIDDDRVTRYLKGETIDADDIGSGYRLLCVEKYPLGFVKQDAARLKNKYYKGWRMN